MIGLELKHIVYALVVAVIAYAIREYLRWRDAVRPKRPHMALHEAWERWLQGVEGHPDQRFIPVGRTAAETPEAARLDVERSLGLIEQQFAGSDDHERTLTRRAILASATLSLQLEALSESSDEARQALIRGYEPGMAELIDNAVASSSIKWIVLRDYARWKFDDAVLDDWFHEYMGRARPYIREKVRLAKEHVLQADPGAGQFAELYDTLLGELRDRMLKSPPKYRFVRSDLE